MTYETISQRIESLTAQIIEKFATVGDLVAWEQQLKWEKQLKGDTMEKCLTMRMGLPMYLIIMEKFGIKAIHVCGTGLWYGVYLQHLFNVTD